jgi:hypothetical protein
VIEKIVSGGQTGVDQAGWRAARRFGIATGGWMPRGFITEDGPKPGFEQTYGARPMATADYPDRTKANVEDSDGTLWIGQSSSPGGRLTRRTAMELGRPYRDVGTEERQVWSPQQTAKWIGDNQIRVLNVAGNRESTCFGIGHWAEQYLMEVLRQLGFKEVADAGAADPALHA